MKDTQQILTEAKAAVRLMTGVTTQQKNNALTCMAQALLRNTDHDDLIADLSQALAKV